MIAVPQVRRRSLGYLPRNFTGFCLELAMVGARVLIAPRPRAFVSLRVAQPIGLATAELLQACRKT
jgi:hypothetical protein